RRGDGVVIALYRIDGAALHGAKQLAGGYQLVGKIQLDLHGALGGLVEGIDGRLDYVFAERRACVGLQAPGDLLRFLRIDVRRTQGCGAGGHGGAGQETASCTHTVLSRVVDSGSYSASAPLWAEIGRASCRERGQRGAEDVG